jgi:hypothetical protein
MQSNHKKRIIAIVSLIVIIVLVVVVLIYELNPPYIDYGINDVSKYYPAEGNAVTVYYFDRGGRASNFYLTLKLTNVTFSNQTEQPYLQVNSTLVKLLFNKGWWGSATPNNKTVFFTIDDDATGFSLDLSLEWNAQNPVYLRTFSLNHLEYYWNGTLNCYDLDYSKSGGVSVDS